MRIYKIANIVFPLTLPLSEEDKNQFLQTVPEEPYDIIMKDELGGNCHITVKDQIPNIVSIHSMPFGTPTEEQEKFKKRGFYKAVLSALNFLGFKSFTVNMQSLDSQQALARLHDTEFISNPRDFSGDSMARRPNTFDIGKQPPRTHKDKWEEEDYKHWQNYKKEYLQK